MGISHEDPQALHRRQLRPAATETILADDFVLRLTRFSAQAGERRVPLLVLHGASAAGTTFRVATATKDGAASDLSFVEYFTREGHEVWLLDWRAGGLDEGIAQLAENPQIRTDMHTAATVDIPRAIDHVYERSGRLAVLAHCMGAGSLSISLALGAVEDKLAGVVLSALGLFYQVPWDGWAKVQDRVLDRVAARGTRFPWISPADEFPAELEGLYRRWPWKPTCHADPGGICHRVSFMFGAPYLEPRLRRQGDFHQWLGKEFGPIPLQHYRHAAQNAARGFAAPIDEGGTAYLKPGRFRDVPVLLMTGSENTLWHRDSIDRMADWLKQVAPGGRQQKLIVPGYGHQDLFWGRNAKTDVFMPVEGFLRTLNAGTP